MAAHTPGPWHVTKGLAPREIRADDGPFIASVYDVAVTYGERNANARVLAAAPELLAALVTIVQSVTNNSDACVFCKKDVYFHDRDCPILFAVQALAKVEDR